MKRIVSVKGLALILGISFFLAVSIAMADERVGNLVFNAMRKIQENHEHFIGEVSVVRQDRDSAINKRELAKEKFQRSGGRTLDSKEYHAEFCYAQAQVYRALYKEAKITNSVAQEQLKVLNALLDSINSESARMTYDAAAYIVEASKPFLENGRTLLNSLAQYKDQITDPIINSRLNSAYETACMLSRYLKSIDRSNMSRRSTHKVLAEKVNGLVDQLNTLYVQSDIFMDMIKDKATVLKMINQVAASEMAVLALSNGSKSVEKFSSNVMNPLLNEYYASDENMEILARGVAESEQDMTARPVSYTQSWATKRIN